MKTLIYLTIAVALSSCASFVEHNRSIAQPAPREIKLTVHKLHGGNYNVRAYAVIQGDVCHVYLRKYPECIAHEVRHCLEGDWHKGEKSDAFCD